MASLPDVQQDAAGAARRRAAVAADRLLPDIDWSVPPDCAARWRFAAPSGSLAALSAGPVEGQRVVLVPGVTGSKEDFHFQLIDLAEAGYRVESFDMAGQYESSDAGPEQLSPPRRSYDYRLFEDDLEAFLEHGATPVHLLGHSFAGIVAARVAARRPALVASLTLLSTPPLAGQVFRGVRLLGPLSRVLPASAIALAMRRSLEANVQGVPPARQRFVEQRLARTRPVSIRQIIALMRRTPSVAPALRGSSFPISIAVGSHDVWPLTLHRRFAGELGASIAVYRTGHSPCETAPHELGADLLALFEKARTTV